MEDSTSVFSLRSSSSVSFLLSVSERTGRPGYHQTMSMNAQLCIHSERRHGLVLTAAFLLVHSSGSQAGSPQALTEKATEEAIAFGRDGTPRPYLLRHTPGGIKPNPVILGNIYTPFIRVALASYKATLEGRRLSVSDVDTTLIEPLLYVAVRMGHISWNDHKNQGLLDARCRPFVSRENSSDLGQAGNLRPSIVRRSARDRLSCRCCRVPTTPSPTGPCVGIQRDGPTKHSRAIRRESHYTRSARRLAMTLFELP